MARGVLLCQLLQKYAPILTTQTSWCAWGAHPWTPILPLLPQTLLPCFMGSRVMGDAAGRCAGHAKDLPRLSEQCTNKSAWHDSWQGSPRTLASPATPGDTPPSSHPLLPPSGPGLPQFGDSHLHGKEFCDSGSMQSSKRVCQT